MPTGWAMIAANIFNVRALMAALAILVLGVGPCQVAGVWSAFEANKALIVDGVEVEARVDALTALRAGMGTGGGGGCRWIASSESVRCSESFAEPCPEGIESTAITYLPTDPSVCRVLARSAIAADRRPNEMADILAWVLGLALLILGVTVWGPGGLLAARRGVVARTDGTEEGEGS
jgi:hypothetical protein